MTVTLNAVPAVSLPGLDTVKLLAPAGDTVKLVDVPVIVLWVAVRVVDWASVSVMAAVPTPEVKVTEDG